MVGRDKASTLLVNRQSAHLIVANSRFVVLVLIIPVRRRNPITIYAERVMVTTLEALRHSEPTPPLGAVSFSMWSRACRLALLRRPPCGPMPFRHIALEVCFTGPITKADRHPCVVIAG